MKNDRDRRRALEQEVGELRNASLVREVTSAPRAAPRPSFDSNDDDFEPGATNRPALLAGLLKRYESSMREQPARDLDELIDLLGAKVADLAEVDAAALAEAATDLSILSLRLARLARRER